MIRNYTDYKKKIYVSLTLNTGLNDIHKYQLRNLTKYDTMSADDIIHVFSNKNKQKIIIINSKLLIRITAIIKLL